MSLTQEQHAAREPRCGNPWSIGTRFLKNRWMNSIKINQVLTQK